MFSLAIICGVVRVRMSATVLAEATAHAKGRREHVYVCQVKCSKHAALAEGCLQVYGKPSFIFALLRHRVRHIQQIDEAVCRPAFQPT